MAGCELKTQETHSRSRAASGAAHEDCEGQGSVDFEKARAHLNPDRALDEGNV